MRHPGKGAKKNQKVIRGDIRYGDAEEVKRNRGVSEGGGRERRGGRREEVKKTQGKENRGG